jgi:glycosyltransferase involved in cell wall biosynthesis
MKVVVGLFSRLVMEKGLDVFSDTIDQLVAKGVKHRVLIVGDGPAREWFENRLPSTRSLPVIRRAPTLAAPWPAWISSSSPRSETFGNVTLEAMACSLPVVCAEATGSESLVDNGHSGRLIRPGHINAFAQAVRAYIEDRPARRPWRRRGSA